MDKFELIKEGDFIKVAKASVRGQTGIYHHPKAGSMEFQAWALYTLKKADIGTWKSCCY